MLQRRTGSHAVFLGVKEENILTCSRGAKAQTHAQDVHRLSRCFFGCEGEKYPHTQTQTHSVFLEGII